MSAGNASRVAQPVRPKLTPNLTPTGVRRQALRCRPVPRFRNKCSIMQGGAGRGSILKTAEVARLPWVRIPPPPQIRSQSRRRASLVPTRDRRAELTDSSRAVRIATHETSYGVPNPLLAPRAR